MPLNPAYFDNNHEHRDIAECALGHPLPTGAVVHHIDGNPSNNAHMNLVICEDQAYHLLLHRRAKAYREMSGPLPTEKFDTPSPR